jgi:hypothetical protein
MSGRPRRREAKDLCERLEGARLTAGLSQAAVARVIGTSSSNLSRSLKAMALSRDLTDRAEKLLERGWSTMRDTSQVRGAANQQTVRRALSLLQELSRMLPDLERALDSGRQDIDLEDSR